MVHGLNKGHIAPIKIPSYVTWQLVSYNQLDGVALNGSGQLQWDFSSLLLHLGDIKKQGVQRTTTPLSR